MRREDAGLWVAVGVAVAGVAGLPVGLLAVAVLMLAPRLPLAEPGWAVLNLLGMAALVGGFASGIQPVIVLSGLLLGLLLHFRVREPKPALVHLLTALMLVVLASRSQSPWFLLGLAGWLWTLFHGRERLLVPVLAIAVPVFVLLPRFGSFELGSDALTGFDEDVELGALQDLLDDPARVFTAHFSRTPEGPVYYRGVALDHFDGRRWWSEAGRTREADYTQALPDANRVDIELSAHAEGVLFVPGTVDGIDTAGLAVERDVAGAYHLLGPPRRVFYRAFVHGPFGVGRGDPFLDAEPRLDLPPLSDDLQVLIRSQAGGGSPAARIDNLSRWLQTRFRYTRAPRDTHPEAPLEHFLRTGREGHCEYFASALAVAGRVIGVPTRVVNGFVGGEPGPDDTVVVRRYHAHSWVEYFDGDRWVLADPTPGIAAPTGPGAVQQLSDTASEAWDALLAWDGQAQLGAAGGLAARVAPFTPPSQRPLLGALLVGAVCGLGLWLVRRAGHPELPKPTCDPCTHALRTLLDDLQGPQRPGVGDLTRVRQVLAVEPDWVELETLALLSYRIRFAGAPSQDPSTLVEAINSRRANGEGGGRG